MGASGTDADTMGSDMSPALAETRRARSATKAVLDFWLKLPKLGRKAMRRAGDVAITFHKFHTSKHSNFTHFYSSSHSSLSSLVYPNQQGRAL